MTTPTLSRIRAAASKAADPRAAMRRFFLVVPHEEGGLAGCSEGDLRRRGYTEQEISDALWGVILTELETLEGPA